MAGVVFTTVVLLRFLVPLAIPRFPLPAIIACLVIDAADQTIFQAFTDDPLEGYQTYDKALDVYYLAIAYFSTMRNWHDPVAFGVARFLYLYRLVGVVLFELLSQRWMLLVFANTFEYFFIAYEAVRTRWNPLRLSPTAVVGIAGFIWVFVKLPQEWWIHIAQNDFTEFMAAHPYMWAVLGAIAVAASVFGWRKRNDVPASDWTFTVDVDRHQPPAISSTVVRERFWSMVLVEKIVLLALIGVIFAQVLPDVRSTNLRLTIGVTVLVVLNAAVTQWLRSRRGATWTTAAGAFVATLAINVGIVLIDSVFGSVRDSNAPALNTLFFMLLLSLLIALFDRFRSTRDPSEEVVGPIDAVREALAERRAATSTAPAQPS